MIPGQTKKTHDGGTVRKTEEPSHCLRPLSPHLEYEAPKRLSDRDAIGILCGKCRCRHVQEIGSWGDVRKVDAIRKGYANGISIRQLSRITGVSKAVIERVLKEF